MKKLTLYLIICAALFNIFPLIALLLGEEAKMLFPILLLFVNPAYAFISGILAAAKNKIGLLYPIAVGILFIPSAFINYNESALPYCLFYFALALIGALIAYFTTRKKGEAAKMKIQDL